MFYRRCDGVISSCESRGSSHAEGLRIGGVSYRVGEIRNRPLQRQLAYLGARESGVPGDNNVCPAAGSFFPLPMIPMLKQEGSVQKNAKETKPAPLLLLQHLQPSPIRCPYPWGILTVILMIYFLFHNQKTNKIFYYLLGRLDVFLFTSSLPRSIKPPFPFSFQYSQTGILFASFLTCCCWV